MVNPWIASVMEQFVSDLHETGESVRWHGVVELPGSFSRWLGLDEADHWLVGVDGGRAEPFGANPASLPLLELRYSDLVGTLTPAQYESLPAADVVDLALSSGGDYWTGLAVEWFEDGYPASTHIEALDRVWSDRRLPQRFRQTAKRLSWSEKLTLVRSALRDSDPTGVVSGKGGTIDDYDMIAPRVLSCVVQGVTPDKLAALLTEVISNDMGLKPDSERIAPAAEAILRALCYSDPPGQ